MTLQNSDVAALLDELADLLEIKGSNPFRIRAYRNAVRTVETLTRPLARMVEEGEDLQSLPGIGKEMAGHIEGMIRTGRFDLLEKVAEEVPRSLIPLVKLEGVGPKKARKLWDELGVETLDELEILAKAGKVETLAGFGKRSVEKMLVSIEELRSLQSRFKISSVEPFLAAIVKWVEQGPGVERLEVAGSYRRCRETLGDVDLLVEAADGGAVVEHFVAFPGAARVEAAGGTKGSLVLRNGLQVDLRVIPAESWGAALHYFTGSKEHNVKIRQIAQRQGLRVNEWGVFRPPPETAPDGSGGEAVAADGETLTGPAAGERVAGSTEEDVFGALGLPWIPPELRENRGEIEAAAEGRLPKLVTLEDMKGDLQMHSTWSDGKHSIEAMALACLERGYEYLAITDHSPALTMIEGLTPEKARRQWEEIAEVQERVPDIHIFRAAEVDILKDGELDLPDDVLEGLDLVLVSIHSLMGMDRHTMTERVLRAIQHPMVDILAHPTGRILNRRTPFQMDVETVLQAAKELDVAVEVNADPNRLDLNDVHVRRAKELGVKVVISTDAHSTRGLGVMRYGVDQARRGWIEAEDVLNTRSLVDFRAWVHRRGG